MEFCVTVEKRGEHLLGSSKSFGSLQNSVKYLADYVKIMSEREVIKHLVWKQIVRTQWTMSSIRNRC